MPNITLYVKDSDLPIIEKAKKKLGESLSVVFTDCVRARLAEAAGVPTGKMRKIVLKFWTDEHGPVIKKSFVGRWLVGDEEDGSRAEREDEGRGVIYDSRAEYSVAQTAKGNLVVYVHTGHNEWPPTMETFETFEAMKNSEVVYPQNVIAETAEALGQPYEIEMDI